MKTSDLTLHEWYYDKQYESKTRFYGREETGQQRYIFMLESPSYLEVIYFEDEVSKNICILN